MDIPANIFRTYDIRGVYGKDLTDEMAYLIGKGLGTFFLENGQKKVAVGRDNRVSGETVTNLTIKGLLESGCDVIFFDFVLNPFIYFSWHHLDFNAAVIVTASHNPPQYNGYKCSMNKKPLLSEDYQKIKNICISGKFKEGKGTKVEREIWPAYKQNILSSLKLGKQLTVAVDCGNGTAGLFVPEILKDLGCKVIPIFCESDGSFPNHIPYPQKVEFYGQLIKTIKNEKADIGLAIDGDGDRLGVYDEKGNFIEGDRLAMIFAEDICKNNTNKKFVMNISTSMAIIDYIKRFGGEVILWKTGYPNISAKMNETNAIFGGEISGHFFFKDRYFGFDDALYAGCRILESLSNSAESLSEISAKLPKYFETREFRIPAPDDKKFNIVENISRDIKKEFPKFGILDFDGLRFFDEDSWGLIRTSNTEPVITGRAEAKSLDKLENIKEIIRAKLLKNDIPLDWSKI